MQNVYIHRLYAKCFLKRKQCHFLHSSNLLTAHVLAHEVEMDWSQYCLTCLSIAYFNLVLSVSFIMYRWSLILH